MGDADGVPVYFVQPEFKSRGLYCIALGAFARWHKIPFVPVSCFVHLPVLAPYFLKGHSLPIAVVEFKQSPIGAIAVQIQAEI